MALHPQYRVLEGVTPDARYFVSEGNFVNRVQTEPPILDAVVCKASSLHPGRCVSVRVSP